MVTRCTRCWFDLRGQLLDGPEHGLTEVIWSPPAQATFEGFTHISARQAEFDMILIICRAVLDKRESENHGRVGGNIPVSL